MQKMRTTLRTLMESAGHTAYDIQEKTGVQTSTIYRYFASDRSDLKSGTVIKLARLYNITESQLRGDVPIEGMEIPAEKSELKDLLTLDEYQFMSNIKNMDKEAREILYKLSSMLAEGHMQPIQKSVYPTLRKVHFTLQGKGGVGKSLVASLIAQYMIQEGKQPLCIDTDPISATFYGYKALNVQHLQIMEGDEINSMMFDELFELISSTDEDVVIDNGANSFIPLVNYLISTQIPSMLQDMEHELVIHTVITGGQALGNTVNGFSQLVTQFPDEARFVVWLNPFWGPIEHEGKSFIDFKAYKDNKERVSAIVEIPSLKHQTFERDLSDMLQKNLTFDEVAESPDFGSVSKSHLAQVKKAIFDQLGSVV